MMSFKWSIVYKLFDKCLKYSLGYLARKLWSYWDQTHTISISTILHQTATMADRTNWLSLGGLHNWPNNVLFTQGRFWKYKVALNIQDFWCYNFFNRENSNLMILRHDLISSTFGVFGSTGYALGHIQPSYFTRWRRASSRAWSYLVFVSREIEK